MSAKILKFVPAMQRVNTTAPAAQRVNTSADAGSVPEPTPTLMPVPAAALQVYFATASPGPSLNVISQLSGVEVAQLQTVWGGEAGLRAAAVRYALSMVIE